MNGSDHIIASLMMFISLMMFHACVCNVFYWERSVQLYGNLLFELDDYVYR